MKEYITEVTRVVIDRYYKDENKSNLLAEITVVINDCIMIHGITVRKGELGKYVAMPHTGMTKKTTEEGKRFRELLHPLSREFQDHMKESVLSAFEEYIAENNA